MYVTDSLIHQMESEFGRSVECGFTIPCTSEELERIRSSQKHGRNHDVTLYIRKQEKLIVIAKHPYPEGLFRAPSGGLEPGEPFRTGIDREMAEEIGCEIRLTRFLLRTAVDFTHGKSDSENDSQKAEKRPHPVFWRSFVFLADYVRGDFAFTDHDEIREVRLAEWSEFASFGAIMRQTDSGGLHYRAELHERIVETITSLGL